MEVTFYTFPQQSHSLSENERGLTFMIILRLKPIYLIIIIN